jgi:RNA polymerase subunit RPABC4/transcription elongation factor Spt4
VSAHAILALLGVESTAVTVAFDLLLVFAVALYLALVYWTYADARRRLEDPTLIGAATALSLVPFAGALIYLILRPAETLEDAYERDLEVEAARLRLHELELRLCPNCDYPIERDYLRCPGCLQRLREPCPRCARALERTWTLCPYCEAKPAAVRGGRSGARRAGSGATQRRSTGERSDGVEERERKAGGEDQEERLTPRRSAGRVRSGGSLKGK